jgi:hypothetical protein
MTERRQAPPKAWKPGQSGNVAGKPPGTRNKATRMVLALMEDGAEAITKKVIELAEAGDLAAARLVIERLAPPVRERPIEVEIPNTENADGVSKAQQAVLEAVGCGELLPGEGQILAGIIEARRKAIETEELERRIAALEAKK